MAISIWPWIKRFSEESNSRGSLFHFFDAQIVFTNTDLDVRFAAARTGECNLYVLPPRREARYVFLLSFSAETMSRMWFV